MHELRLWYVCLLLSSSERPPYVGTLDSIVAMIVSVLGLIGSLLCIDDIDNLSRLFIF